MAGADLPGKLADVLGEWRILFSSSGRKKKQPKKPP